MKISWRPNRRASSENTPGPSKKIATAMTIISKAASFPSSNRPAPIGSQESARARVPMVIKILTTGVRNPIKRQAAHAVSARQIIMSATRVPELEIHIRPCAETMAPTTTRIKSSPDPGLPPGNVENSRCRVILPGICQPNCHAKLHRDGLGGHTTSRYFFHHSFGVWAPADLLAKAG